MAKSPAPQSKTVEQRRAAKSDAVVYLVISPLQHDGEAYAEGDELELTADQAAPLLGHTVVAKTEA